MSYPHGSQHKFFLVGNDDLPVYMGHPSMRPVYLNNGAWQPYHDLPTFFRESSHTDERTFRDAMHERGEHRDARLP
jgi:hypothetical protein